MSGSTFHFSSLLAVLLLGAAVISTTNGARNIDPVCENIASFFNALNQAMPLRASIPASKSDSSLSYAQGIITFTQVARSLKKCVAYVINDSTIVRIKVASAINIILSKFMDIEKEVNLSASEAEIELHYVISKINDDHVKLTPILTEVRDLGEVEIQMEGKEEQYSDQAEDLLRPLLYTVADRFTKESLTFHIKPSDYDPSEAAYDAFKTIFKAYMYNQHTNNNPSTPTPSPTPEPTPTTESTPDPEPTPTTESTPDPEPTPTPEPNSNRQFFKIF